MDVTGRAGTPDWARLLSNIPLPEQNLLGIAAGVVLQRLVPVRLCGAAGWAPSLLRAAGMASLAVGGFLVAWSWFAARGTRLAAPGVLVTSGPYALSRNPMYVGWALLHVGIGLVRRDAWILVTVPMAAAAVHRQVLREEDGLAASFSEAFSGYRQAVPRYVGLGRLKGPEWRVGRPLPRLH